MTTPNDISESPVAAPERPKLSLVQKISFVATAALLLIILKGGLVGTLISGLAVYVGVHALAPYLPRAKNKEGILARQIALALITVVVVGILVAGGAWAVDFLRGSGAGLNALLLRMGEIVAQLREILPAWATRSLPSSAIAMNDWIAQYLTDNANFLQTTGQTVLKGMTHILLGAVLGGMIAISQENKGSPVAPLARAMLDRVQHLTVVFGQVVGAQLRISLINTLFTGIFLLVILPMTGNPLPFTKTMILITFVAGLIPVLGNLISNTVITVIALSVSLWVAVAALAFLIVIHKLEYFLNAKIIGTQIQARAWELLAAMLVMEACFGLPGVIAAPIFYAYVKRELRQVGWI